MVMRKHFFRLWSYFLFACLLTACAGGSGPSVRYYLIDPLPDTLPDVVSGTAVEIIDVHVPQYLERFQIASRADNNRLEFSDNHQWAEPLRKNLLRTMAVNLSRLLNTSKVSTPLNRSLYMPDFRVQIDIEQFEPDQHGIVVLAARWQLTEMSGDKAVSVYHLQEQGTERIDAGDYNAMIVSMQELYGRLATSVSQSIQAAR